MIDGKQLPGLKAAACLRRTGVSGTPKSISVAGFRAEEITLPEASGLAFVHGDEGWVVLAKGVDAPSLLHEVAARLKLSH